MASSSTSPAAAASTGPPPKGATLPSHQTCSQSVSSAVAHGARACTAPGRACRAWQNVLHFTVFRQHHRRPCLVRRAVHTLHGVVYPALAWRVCRHIFIKLRSKLKAHFVLLAELLPSGRGLVFSAPPQQPICDTTGHAPGIDHNTALSRRACACAVATYICAAVAQSLAQDSQ